MVMVFKATLSTLCHERILTLVVIGTECIGSCKFNYHMITITTYPHEKYVLLICYKRIHEPTSNTLLFPIIITFCVELDFPSGFLKKRKKKLFFIMSLLANSVYILYIFYIHFIYRKIV